MTNIFLITLVTNAYACLLRAAYVVLPGPAFSCGWLWNNVRYILLLVRAGRPLSPTVSDCQCFITMTENTMNV